MGRVLVGPDGNRGSLAGGPANTDVDQIEETAMGETTAEASSSGLMVDLIISLDGYASAEGWPGWWGLEGPEYLAWLEQEGRRTTPSFSGRTRIG